MHNTIGYTATRQNGHYIPCVHLQTQKRLVQPFYVIAPYHTSYYLLHWIVHPSYLLPNGLFRVVSYCHPTLDSTPSYLILPHLTTPYPVTPPYPNTVLLQPTPSNHSLHRPTLTFSCQPALSYLFLLQPTAYTVSYCLPNLVLHCFFCDSTLYYLILPQRL